MSERCLIIIPTFQEKENIGHMIRRVMSLNGGYDLLVVDDGSPDGTAGIVRDMMAQFEGKVHLIERQGKLGLGTAYIAGFKWGLARDYAYFFEMDADFSHNPDDLVRLYEACAVHGADVSIGSRYVRGGGVTNWTAERRILSRVASLYVRVITGMPVRDATAGFVCYRRKVLEKIDLDGIRFIGYAFQIEMKFKSRLAGFVLREVPIIFTDRIAGVSKMSAGIIHEAIFGVIRLKWDSLWRRA